jgi:replicative DNA helicase
MYNLLLMHTSLRAPPSDERLEQEIIGAVLRNNSLYEHIVDTVEPPHFAHPIHREIYQAIQALSLAGKALTPISIGHLIKTDQNAVDLLIDFTANVLAATPSGIKSHAQKLYDLYLRRQLICIADRLSGDSFHSTDDAWSHLERAEQSLFQIAADHGNKSEPITIARAVSNALIQSEAARKSGKQITGVPTGLIDLDLQLGGLHDSDLIIIAGRPSMGKTALGCCVAFNAAKAGYPVAFFSLEMSADQLGNRLLSQVARIPSHKVRCGSYSNTDMERLVRAAQDFDHPLHIDDSPGLTIQSIRTRIRRMCRQHGIKLVVIDYLQLLSAGGSAENRLQEISEITRTLKAIAKELNIPILALSQLSRAVEQRDDKKPQLADLRESGTIEQDSDVVMFIYRAAYYLIRKKPDETSDKIGEWQEQMAECINQAEVLIAKQRHGPVGTVKLHYDERWTLFSNIDYSDLMGNANLDDSSDSA